MTENNKSDDKVERKRGKLSLAEMEFISQNCRTMSVESIAERINRTIEPVLRYLKENDLPCAGLDESQEEEEMFKRRLKSGPHWKGLIAQFNNEEMEHFVIQWVTYMRQFKGDVLPTEEMQLKQYIITEMLVGDILKRRKEVNETIDEYTTRLNREKKKPEGERNDVAMATWEELIAQAKMNAGTIVKDYTTLSEELKRINKELKGTREQRVKQIEDSKENWTGLAKRWNDAEYRETEGRDAELFRLASLRARDILSQFHTYLDGVVDRPFLTPESVGEEDAK